MSSKLNCLSLPHNGLFIIGLFYIWVILLSVEVCVLYCRVLEKVYESVTDWNHIKHTELGRAAASVSFSVEGQQIDWTGLLTAGGQGGSAARKVQIG